ncbi:MAG: hypothetical protein Q9M89_09835 [Persephonella sp.]|nr:hypothetical protein [Persephonella sp.]
MLQLFETLPSGNRYCRLCYLYSSFYSFFSINPSVGKKVPYKNLKLSITERGEKIKIDFRNPKKTAYTITYLIHRYETPYNTELLERLEKHKYRKEVSNFDKETEELIKKFVEYVKLKNARV